MKNYSFNRIAMTCAAAALAAGITLSGSAQSQDAGAHHKVISGDEITFQPGPGTLPAGVQVAVLHGNPAEEGPFVLRLKFPAGYVIPPHMHPEEEHVTVISGKFGIGSGTEFDTSSLTMLQGGGFVQIPTGMPHFARAEDETVVQINAMGPFGITYVNPKEDPRIN